MGDYHPLKIDHFFSSSFKNKQFKQKYKLYDEGSEFSKINAVEFNASSPSRFTISSGTKVSIYDLDQKKITGDFSAPKNIVNCAAFRNDGKLIAVGDDSSYIHILNAENRMRLRRFKQHAGPVRCCNFASNKTHFMSGSDDTTLRLWDIPQEACVHILKGHTDSVRAITRNLALGQLDLWASGSYDGFVKLWDTRNNSASESMTIDHGSPVEDVAFFSNGIHLASAGGNSVKIWDLSAGGRLLKDVVHHMKTVTSVRISSDDSRLLTGSLDRTVKWSCSRTDEILKSYFFKSEVMSVSISATDDAFAVGFADGSWCVRRAKESVAAKISENVGTSPNSLSKKAHRSAARYYNCPSNGPHASEAVQVPTAGKKANSPLDVCLRNFQYKDALDVSLTLSSAHVVNLLEELIRRGAVSIALGGRDEATILPTLQFMYRNIGGDLRYTSIILESLQILLDENEWMYSSTDSGVLEMLKRISQKLGFELMQQNTLQEVQGVLDMILAA